MSGGSTVDGSPTLDKIATVMLLVGIILKFGAELLPSSLTGIAARLRAIGYPLIVLWLIASLTNQFLFVPLS